MAALAAICSCGLLVTPYAWLVLAGVTGALALMALADYRWLQRHADSDKATLAIPQSIQREETLTATVTVENAGTQPMRLQVRPILPEQGVPSRKQAALPLEPGQRAQLPFTIEALVRGQYRFGDLYVRVTAPRAMFQAQVRLPNDQICRVYPEVQRVREYLLTRRMRTMAAPHMRTMALRGIGSEFESLRDYEQGDDIRRIDWRATAKHRKLITRNYEVEPFRNVLVIVDRGRLMAAQVGTGTKLDCAVDAALMVSAVALDSGDRCGLLVFDSDVAAYIPPAGSLSQLPRILDALYDIEPVLEESHFLRAFGLLQSRLFKRSLIVVLTDVIDIDVSRSTLEALLGLGKRHMVVVAALRTPATYDVLTAPVTDKLDPFRKAAAHRLVNERREVLAHLRKGGVHLLDVHPDDLTVPLVNKYIELREQNRL